MANFTIKIPNDKVDAVVDALCKKFDYTDTLNMTKPQFAKKQILNFIKKVYIEQTKADFTQDRRKKMKDAETYVSDLDIS